MSKLILEVDCPVTDVSYEIVFLSNRIGDDSTIGLDIRNYNGMESVIPKIDLQISKEEAKILVNYLTTYLKL